jgi:hypothetical protein
MIIVEQRKQYLRKSRKAWSFELLVAKSLSAKMRAKVRRKNFYGESSLFIGAGGGVVQESRLDMTVASFTEDACPL